MFAPLQRLEDGLFQKSRTMGPPWGPVLRLLRYPAAIVRDWLAGEISVRAMSLAYTTLLSLVPLMVFSFSILKGLGARSDLRFILQEFFRPLGERRRSADRERAAVRDEYARRCARRHRPGIPHLHGHQHDSKGGGQLQFRLAVDRPRNFARRFTEYLSVMIVGPILLAVALGTLGRRRAQPGRAVARLRRASGMDPERFRAARTVRDRHHRLRLHVRLHSEHARRISAALIGGVTAGVIWALVGKAFTAFIVYSSQMVAVYTGFAIVLTTLIWVYLSWLILLIGAQLAFYVQFPQYLRYGHQTSELTGSAREQIGLSVMYLIGRDYQRGPKPLGRRRTRRGTRRPRGGARPDPCMSGAAGLIVATERSASCRAAIRRPSSSPR